MTGILEKLRQASRYTKALANGNDLEKLSDKKRTALDSITYGLTQCQIDDEFKQAFFNSALLMLRMINDNEVDKLAMANHEASQAYLMKYFYQDIDNLDIENKKAMKFLFREYQSMHDVSNQEIPKDFKQKFWIE